MDTKDDLIWKSCPENDLWVFNKLTLARKLGYKCGPKGVDVPTPGNYIVRPCINIMGMSRGAKIVYIEQDTDNHSEIPDGYFWCQLFTGRHLSVDYINQNQVLCVEGFKNENTLYKFNKWLRVKDEIPYPKILYELQGKHRYVNVEMIGDKIIEIHLRLNPDFEDNVQEIFPVWENESIIPPTGYKFVESKEYKRLGFFVRR